MLEYQVVGLAELDAIKPLWENLHAHHRVRCQEFGGWFAGYDFSRRKADVLLKAREADIRLELVKDSDAAMVVAYCLSSVSSAGVGELDSLFVLASHRELGIGGKLAANALAWLQERAAGPRRIIVFAGNEEVLPFYAQYGFLPRYIVLEQP